MSMEVRRSTTLKYLSTLIMFRVVPSRIEVKSVKSLQTNGNG